MKTEINKSVKRAISLVLAFVLLIGTLFTANIGVNIKADAETTDTIVVPDGKRIEYWDGTELTGWWAAETDGTYKISTAAQLYYACMGTRDGTNGKTFVIDDTIYAFIMQPESVIVDKLGGPAAVINLSGAEETRKFFEETYTATGNTPVNWSRNANQIFNGNFDGSHVPIYGIYCDAIATEAQAASFFQATKDLDATDAMEIANLVIKNSYFKGYYRTSILFGCSWGDSIYSYISVDSCIFANCYLLGQNYKSSAGELYATSVKTNEMGVLGGGVSNDPVQLSNTLVYGNETEYDYYVENDSGEIVYSTTTKDAFNWVFSSNTSGNQSYYGSIKNCIILDAVVNNLTEDSTTYCENVYGNIGTGYTTVTNMFDNESVKGAHGRYYMSGLDWDSAWWAIENDYPTPFKPSDDYVSVEAKEFEGSGTEAEPYLIYCAKQLDTMVTNGGKVGDVCKYYKVADGVDAIYINPAESLEEIKALYSAGSYNNWIHGTTAFHGNFDGNGVTIYGMICKTSDDNYKNESVGFVPKLSTTEAAATIKNVNFAGVYITSHTSAAVVSSQVSGWSETEDSYQNNPSLTSYITSVTVRESYIKAAYSGDTSVTTVTDANGTVTGTYNTHNATAAGILSTNNVTPDHVTIAYCLYDGGSCELYDGNTTDTPASAAAAGIVSMNSGGNEITVDNCVSIGVNAIPMVSKADYDYSNRYVNSAHEFNMVYGDIPDGFDTSSYAECANCYDIDSKTSFAMLDMPLLNWGGAWLLVDVDDDGDGKTDRTIPMPKTSDETIDSYSTQLANQNGGNGASLPSGNRYGGYEKGKYGMYEEFLGSGTKDDPYIISDALGLARAIACGGKDITTKLYYKLSCDIDVGTSWINEVTVAGKYVYVPFEGHIDGDGHTIYNLYSTATNASLIPVIVEGATVKNLHIRNSYINSTATAGAIFGTYQDAPNSNENTVYIEGCSVEGTDIAGTTTAYLVGDTANATIINSYYVVGEKSEYSEYYLADGTTGTPTVDNADFYGEENVTDPVWYKGGENDCMPQLVNRAKAMTEVDISGYGDNDYEARDIAALRQRLLGNTAYANVYGDVSRDGKTSIGDLAILRRQLVGSYNMYADGFWRNAALGNIVIYYGENDNYDFARKLELALENEFGKDVKKVVVGEGAEVGTDVSYGSLTGGLYVHKNDIYYDATNGKYYKLNEDASTGAITPDDLDPNNEADAAEIAKYALDDSCQIVVGKLPGTKYATNSITFVKDDNAEACDQYGITYDKANSAVWLQGGSFTAVEQATIDFINNSNPDSSYVYTTNGAVALDTNKEAKTVDGTTYYYAWGDEFNSGSLNKDSWNYDPMQNESSEPGKYYANLETAFPEDIEKLYEVTDAGKLKIWRGYYGETGSDLDWGYKYLGKLADKGVTGETSDTNDDGDINYKDVIAGTKDNLFGGAVEASDIYATAGKIVTNKSMLVKQGYLEMKASYPEDGHAFSCWWLVGYSGGKIASNNDIGNTLFGKVFKLNNIAAYNDDGDPANAWDGTNALNSSIPSTFKYQLPNASYEIDIAEFMQMGTYGGDRDYKTANFTFHKFYGNGIYTVDGVNKIKFINWDSLLKGGDAHHTVTFSDGFKVGKYSGNAASASMTAVSFSEFLYDTKLDGTTTSISSYINYTTYNGEMIDFNRSESHFIATPGTVEIEGGQEYIFGVKWDATDTTALYTFTVKNADTGEDVMDPLVIEEDITYEQDAEGTVTTILSKLSSLETDQQTANQYMYMLIDNTYATSAAGSESNYDDLLTQDSNSSKIATMEIDYVRVYQQKRDIVTPDTEEFNNGNHFGY